MDAWFRAGMATKNKKKDETVQQAFEEILSAIIDEWYERVSGYYVTEEAGPDDPEIELKRFHDDNGHRIKFNKDSLDFTYGLRAAWSEGSFHLDISVNNKVEDFDYENFKQQLFDHYRKAGKSRVSTPPKLKKFTHSEVFRLESGISRAFTVEKRNKRADIMRLSFEINPEHLEARAKERQRTKQLIESYCVSPFRNIYARVYRSNT